MAAGSKGTVLVTGGVKRLGKAIAEALRADGWRVLVFSHVPPLPEIHVWSREIRHGRAMLRALEALARSGRNPVLGWIHGHNHTDQIIQPGRVPVIGIGCSKLESFPEHKPEGSRTWPRKPGCPEQELWDAVLIPDGENRLYLFRYGAGADRRVPEPERRAD